MTTDLKIKLLSDLMALREQLAAIQVHVSEMTAIVSASDFYEPDSVLTHAMEPMLDASLHDEPPSKPLVEVTSPNSHTA